MKRIYGMAMLAALFALVTPAQDSDSKKQLDAHAADVQKQLEAGHPPGKSVSCHGIA
jgi:hypothetical protein